MSFGFSIGDIVLLSKIAYNLYTSVNSGRKGASRDLQELEDVLFSLRCALDHLSEVSKEVLAQSVPQPGRPDLKENLDRMINSCGTTLRELDDVTRKYREVGIDKEGEKNTDDGAKMKRTFDDRLKWMKVNWKKVRWDQEKQSLQQYREKLRSHTDAINIILTSVIWQNANQADSSSRTNHEKTHSLLNQVLTNPRTDTSLHQLVKEIHSIVTQPTPNLPSPMGMPARSAQLAEGESRRGNGGSEDSTWSKPAPHLAGTASVFAMSATMNPPGPGFTTLSSSGPNRGQMAGAIGSTMQPYAGVQAFMSIRESGGVEEMDDSVETNLNCGLDTRPVHGYTTRSMKPEVLSGPSQISASIIALNNTRRAVATKEFEAYKERHAKPEKPSFLTLSTPSVLQLQASLSYILRSLPDTGTNAAHKEAQERSGDIMMWTAAFLQIVKDDTRDVEMVDLLVCLNDTVAKSAPRARAIFYECIGRAGLEEGFEMLQERTKSVRIMKEIEEFEDERELWKDERSKR